MIRCVDCGAEQYIGALFCNECGSFLLEQDNKGNTAVLPFSDFISPTSARQALNQEQLETAVAPRLITAVIPSRRLRLQLKLQDQIQVGRADPETTPELDLSQYDGAEKGVSRLHALIRAVKSGIVLIDLDSTNGTTLNAFRLPPHRPYPLKTGDEIRFGDLLVHIFFD